METVGDIVKEMRANGICYDNRHWSELCSRIESAYNDQLSIGKMCTMACRESGELLEQYAKSEKRLLAEIKRLSISLRPVLEYDINSGNTLQALFTVLKAKEIYNEGAK